MAAEKAEMDALKKECDGLRAQIEVSVSCGRKFQVYLQHHKNNPDFTPVTPYFSYYLACILMLLYLFNTNLK